MSPLHRVLAGAALAFGLVTSPHAAVRSAAHPDLSGYWSLSRQQPAPDPDLQSRLTPGAVVLHDTGPTELPIGDFGGLLPTPEALAAAKAWSPRDEMALNKVCASPSIIYAMQGPFPLQVLQGTEFVIIRLEYFDMTRIVYMTRGHLPADAPHSKLGDSVGHWEGSTLVVDTTHLEASTITNNGLNHSDQVHVVERFKLAPGGKTLLSTQEFDDPVALQNLGARFIAWDRQEGQYIYPYECDPTYGQNYGAAK